MQIRWTPRAAREMDQLAESAPRVASAVVEFVYGDLAAEPFRVGSALRFELTRLYSARRAEYRVVYRVSADREVVQIERVGHRRKVYRR